MGELALLKYGFVEIGGCALSRLVSLFSGLADNFPTFDDNTVIVTPLNGLFDPNPTISPPFSETEVDAAVADGKGRPSDSPNIRDYLSPYLPSTFRHCAKSRLGLNSRNVTVGSQMILSSDDDVLYARFREGYDDARQVSWGAASSKCS